MWQYTYGHLHAYSAPLPFNVWGDQKRVNTVTDPASNTTYLAYLTPVNPITNLPDYFGPIIGLDVIAPPYGTNGAASNRTKVVYGNSYARPSSVTIYDPLYWNGIVNQTW